MLALPKLCAFSTNAVLRRTQNEPTSQEVIPGVKQKTTRAPAAKTSLRRAAVEAQRSRDGNTSRRQPFQDESIRKHTVTAYCVAEQYDLAHVVDILQGHGYELDPSKTGLYPQVVHIEMPTDQAPPRASSGRDQATGTGDVFIFPSGTLVAWAVPKELVSILAKSTLLPAAQNPHLDSLETEDLDYVEDSTRDNSSIKGDAIILGTKSSIVEKCLDGPSPESGENEPHTKKHRDVDTVLAKIAYSSGLARSTKLAVLESLLSDYFETTRAIPKELSHGSRLGFTRSFILQKTGQLLSLRAQLNLYSELTDSLPDLFWDSRHELGLEGYYDQVGRALDIGIRIKVLNEKMDYAQEIASVLREQLSEKHSLRLEWIIIILIAVEVCFGIRTIWKENGDHTTKTP